MVVNWSALLLNLLVYVFLTAIKIRIIACSLGFWAMGSYFDDVVPVVSGMLFHSKQND